MSQFHISSSDIVVGVPLKWDAFDADGKLLLRKGQIVQSERQLASLIEQGLFTNAASHQAAHERSELEIKTETPSALRKLNTANKRMERLLLNLNPGPDTKPAILDIVKLIIEAVDLQRDIALGCIVLNQSAGTYSIRHGIDTAVMALVIMRSMNKTPDETLIVMAAALTMNLGMQKLQDHLIAQATPPTPDEQEAINRHPLDSVSLLRAMGIDDPEWLELVLLHHEKTDGSGYPGGQNNQLPISQNVKILSAADQYCACVSRREYRKTLAHNVALRTVLMPEGKPVDPVLAAHFIKTLGTYPPGTCVRLNNNEVCVVIEAGDTPATPVVQALAGTTGAPLSMPLKRTTVKQIHGIKEIIPADPRLLRFSLQQLWGERAAL